MKAESNVRPENKFEIENIIDGRCEIVFYDNIQELEPLEEGQTRYSYDIYRYKTSYRDGLEKDLNDDEDKYQEWLNIAKETENKETADAEIARLQEELNNTDYKIIKCSEYQLASLPIPYDIAELHANRQRLRDRINELQEL